MADLRPLQDSSDGSQSRMGSTSAYVDEKYESIRAPMFYDFSHLVDNQHRQILSKNISVTDALTDSARVGENDSASSFLSGDSFFDRMDEFDGPRYRLAARRQSIPCDTESLLRKNDEVTSHHKFNHDTSSRTDSDRVACAQEKLRNEEDDADMLDQGQKLSGRHQTTSTEHAGGPAMTERSRDSSPAGQARGNELLKALKGECSPGAKSPNTKTRCEKAATKQRQGSGQGFSRERSWASSAGRLLSLSVGSSPQKRALSPGSKRGLPKSGPSSPQLTLSIDAPKQVWPGSVPTFGKSKAKVHPTAAGYEAAHNRANVTCQGSAEENKDPERLREWAGQSHSSTLPEVATENSNPPTPSSKEIAGARVRPMAKLLASSLDSFRMHAPKVAAEPIPLGPSSVASLPPQAESQIQGVERGGTGPKNQEERLPVKLLVFGFESAAALASSARAALERPPRTPPTSSVCNDLVRPCTVHHENTDQSPQMESSCQHFRSSTEEGAKEDLVESGELAGKHKAREQGALCETGCKSSREEGEHNAAESDTSSVEELPWSIPQVSSCEDGPAGSENPHADGEATYAGSGDAQSVSAASVIPHAATEYEGKARGFKAVKEMISNWRAPGDITSRRSSIIGISTLSALGSEELSELSKVKKVFRSLDMKQLLESSSENSTCLLPDVGMESGHQQLGDAVGGQAVGSVSRLVLGQKADKQGSEDCTHGSNVRESLPQRTRDLSCKNASPQGSFVTSVDEVSDASTVGKELDNGSFLREIRADSGGTEILKFLQDIAEGSEGADSRRNSLIGSTEFILDSAGSEGDGGTGEEHRVPPQGLNEVLDEACSALVEHVNGLEPQSSLQVQVEEAELELLGSLKEIPGEAVVVRVDSPRSAGVDGVLSSDVPHSVTTMQESSRASLESSTDKEKAPGDANELSRIAPPPAQLACSGVQDEDKNQGCLLSSKPRSPKQGISISILRRTVSNCSSSDSNNIMMQNNQHCNNSSIIQESLSLVPRLDDCPGDPLHANAYAGKQAAEAAGMETIGAAVLDQNIAAFVTSGGALDAPAGGASLPVTDPNAESNADGQNGRLLDKGVQVAEGEPSQPAPRRPRFRTHGWGAPPSSSVAQAPDATNRPLVSQLSAKSVNLKLPSGNDHHATRKSTAMAEKPTGQVARTARTDEPAQVPLGREKPRHVSSSSDLASTSAKQVKEGRSRTGGSAAYSHSGQEVLPVPVPQSGTLGRLPSSGFPGGQEGLEHSQRDRDAGSLHSTDASSEAASDGDLPRQSSGLDATAGPKGAGSGSTGLLQSGEWVLPRRDEGGTSAEGPGGNRLQEERRAAGGKAGLAHAGSFACKFKAKGKEGAAPRSTTEKRLAYEQERRQKIEEKWQQKQSGGRVAAGQMDALEEAEAEQPCPKSLKSDGGKKPDRSALPPAAAGPTLLKGRLGDVPLAMPSLYAGGKATATQGKKGALQVGARTGAAKRLSHQDSVRGVPTGTAAGPSVHRRASADPKLRGSCNSEGESSGPRNCGTEAPGMRLGQRRSSSSEGGQHGDGSNPGLCSTEGSALGPSNDCHRSSGTLAARIAAGPPQPTPAPVVKQPEAKPGRPGAPPLAPKARQVPAKVDTGRRQPPGLKDGKAPEAEGPRKRSREQNILSQSGTQASLPAPRHLDFPPTEASLPSTTTDVEPGQDKILPTEESNPGGSSETSDSTSVSHLSELKTLGEKCEPLLKAPTTTSDRTTADAPPDIPTTCSQGLPSVLEVGKGDFFSTTSTPPRSFITAPSSFHVAACIHAPADSGSVDQHENEATAAVAPWLSVHLLNDDGNHHSNGPLGDGQPEDSQPECDSAEAQGLGGAGLSPSEHAPTGHPEHSPWRRWSRRGSGDAGKMGVSASKTATGSLSQLRALDFGVKRRSPFKKGVGGFTAAAATITASPRASRRLSQPGRDCGPDSQLLLDDEVASGVNEETVSVGATFRSDSQDTLGAPPQEVVVVSREVRRGLFPVDTARSSLREPIDGPPLLSRNSAGSNSGEMKGPEAGRVGATGKDGRSGLKGAGKSVSIPGLSRASAEVGMAQLAGRQRKRWTVPDKASAGFTGALGVEVLGSAVQDPATGGQLAGSKERQSLPPACQPMPLSSSCATAEDQGVLARTIENPCGDHAPSGSNGPAAAAEQPPNQPKHIAAQVRTQGVSNAAAGGSTSHAAPAQAAAVRQPGKAGTPRKKRQPETSSRFALSHKLYQQCIKSATKIARGAGHGGSGPSGRDIAAKERQGSHDVDASKVGSGPGGLQHLSEIQDAVNAGLSVSGAASQLTAKESIILMTTFSAAGRKRFNDVAARERRQAAEARHMKQARTEVKKREDYRAENIVHRARPVPNFSNPFEPIKSNKRLTVPVSPKLGLKTRTHVPGMPGGGI